MFIGSVTVNLREAKESVLSRLTQSGQLWVIFRSSWELRVFLLVYNTHGMKLQLLWCLPLQVMKVLKEGFDNIFQYFNPFLVDLNNALQFTVNYDEHLRHLCNKCVRSSYIWLGNYEYFGKMMRNLSRTFHGFQVIITHVDVHILVKVHVTHAKLRLLSFPSRAVWTLTLRKKRGD